MDYFYQPLPPIQCWRRRKHRSMQWPNFRTSDHVGINFQNSRNFPTLEKSPWCLQHWIGGKGFENKRFFREKQTFRPSSLKTRKTRMRAKDFGTPFAVQLVQLQPYWFKALVNAQRNGARPAEVVRWNWGESANPHDGALHSRRKHY